MSALVKLTRQSAAQYLCQMADEEEQESSSKYYY